jgi:uncharacterized membrane protein YhaH (DUF805 family)
MAGFLSAATFRFLFRDDRGRIDRRTWWLAMAALAAAWLLALVAQRILNRSEDITKVAITAAFVIASIFLAVCYYFVSAKRFNDRGRPSELALLLPAAIFIEAGLHWLGPSLVDLVPDWCHDLTGGVVIAVALWNVTELGVLPGLDGPPR